MSRIGPIVIAEDDQDDRQLLEEAFQSLAIKNKLVFFDNGDDVLAFLRATQEQPFLILSDINLLKMSGIELKKRINEDEALRKKSIPFIFLTTSSEHRSVLEAYEMMVQGYFKKENSFQQIQNTVRMIVEYWLICRHPNSR